jgi:hypothetical protein
MGGPGTAGQPAAQPHCFSAKATDEQLMVIAGVMVTRILSETACLGSQLSEGNETVIVMMVIFGYVCVSSTGQTLDVQPAAMLEYAPPATPQSTASPLRSRRHPRHYRIRRAPNHIARLMRRNRCDHSDRPSRDGHHIHIGCARIQSWPQEAALPPIKPASSAHCQPSTHPNSAHIDKTSCAGSLVWVTLGTNLRPHSPPGVTACRRRSTRQ